MVDFGEEKGTIKANNLKNMGSYFIYPEKLQSQKNLYDFLDYPPFRIRPWMYLGTPYISTLRTFINWFLTAEGLYCIESKKTFPDFWYFHEFVKVKYNWTGSTAWWNGIILDECKWDEKLAFDTFFTLFDEFKKIYIEEILYCTLQEKNLDFHIKNTQRRRFYNNAWWPAYHKALSVYIFKCSHNFWYVYWILDERWFNEQNCEMPKSIDSIKDEVTKEFWSWLKWKKYKWNIDYFLHNKLK